MAFGFRFFGGRHFRILATYTSLRCSEIEDSRLSNRFPARPTNGIPCLSSCDPGASPMKIMCAVSAPDPMTTLVRVLDNRHFVHCEIEVVRRFI